MAVTALGFMKKNYSRYHINDRIGTSPERRSIACACIQRCFPHLHKGIFYKIRYSTHQPVHTEDLAYPDKLFPSQAVRSRRTPAEILFVDNIQVDIIRGLIGFWFTPKDLTQIPPNKK